MPRAQTLVKSETKISTNVAVGIGVVAIAAIIATFGPRMIGNFAVAPMSSSLGKTATSTATSTTAYGCTDSDGGKNFEVKGTVSAPGLNLPDTCKNATTLNEGFCDDKRKYVGAVEQTCQNGCSQGACVQPPVCEATTILGVKFQLSPCYIEKTVIDNGGNVSFGNISIVTTSTLYQFQVGTAGAVAQDQYGNQWPAAGILGGVGGGAQGTNIITGLTFADKALNTSADQTRIYQGYLPVLVKDIYDSQGPYQTLKLNFKLTLKPSVSTTTPTSSVQISMVSADSSVVSADGGNNDLGTFRIKYKVKAIGGPVYISSQADVQASGSTPGKTTVAVDRSNVAGFSSAGMAVTLANLTDSSRTAIGNYKIEKDAEETFEVITAVQLPGAMNAGLYRAALAGVRWSSSDIAVPTNLYNTGLSIFRTSYINLN